MKSLFKACLLLSLTSSVLAEDLEKNLSSVQLAPSTIITSLAIGSCFSPQRSDTIWETVLDKSPQLFLMMGDNVYAQKEEADTELPYLKSAYRQLAASIAFAELRQQTEVLAVWDDHDYGMNDAGASWMAKKQSETLFESAWGLNENDPRRQRDGIYFSRTFGIPGKTLQIILLDTRFFRSDLPQADKSGMEYVADTSAKQSMLGEDQWQWLEEILSKPADIRLLVSSVQVLSGQGKSEGWYLLPKERQKLFDLLKKTSVKNIFLLSGDRHFSAIYKAEDLLDAPLYELTSSSMNQPIGGKKRQQLSMTKEPYEFSNKVFDQNFMQLFIDWDTRRLLVSVTGSSGETLLEQPVDLIADP